MIETSEPLPVEFEADRIEVTVVVAVRHEGRKVREIPLKGTLCYPFDLAALLPAACDQARQQWERERGES